MPIFIILSAILLILILMLYLKINPFIALIISSFYVGLMSMLSIQETITSIQKGIGDTLSGLLLIIVFGAMLGKLVSESGAAEEISHTFYKAFGKKGIIWAVVLTAFVIGIPLFYTAGFVLLIPLVFTMAATARLSPVYIGIPMAAALSVTHGFLPPHPGPVALSSVFKADMGLVLIYGIIISIPTIILAGPVFANFVKNIYPSSKPNFKADTNVVRAKRPSFTNSIWTALLPVILIAFASIVSFLNPDSKNIIFQIVNVLGNPPVAMLIAVCVAIYTLGLRQSKKIEEVMGYLSESVSAIGMIILVIAAGGAFKQILIDSKAGDYFSEILKATHLSPLVLSWTAAAIIRLALGSATVAALTSAGIIIPLITGFPVNKELIVLAIGAGSLMFSHVNDAGFWIFKEYFNLSVIQTLRTWSVMETIVSICGLIGVLVLERFV